MSVHPIAAAPALEGGHGRAPSLGLAVILGLSLAVVLTLPRALAVWHTGVFIDPDDAMRAVEIRDWLAGQGWFDLVPHRLSPGHPFSMHWSRLADLPLAALVRLFGLVATPMTAERLMRLVAPPLYFAGSLWATVRIADRMIGRAAAIPAALLLTTAFEFLALFLPGHIHHHGAQAMLLLLATTAGLDACGPGARPRHAIGCSAALVISLGIGLQNLPFVLAIIGGFLGLWIIHGRSAAPSLSWFGAGLALCAAPIFLLDVPPSHYLDGACDAFSAAHLLTCVWIGTSLVVLSLVAGWGASKVHRVAMAFVSIAGALILLAWLYPACLGDPMAGVDPLLRQEWLADVGEALPLLRLIHAAPASGLPLLMTLVCGAAATAAALIGSPTERERWALLAVLTLAGFVGTLWQVRVAASTCAFMVPGVAWVVLQVFRIAVRRPGRPALFLAILTGMVGNGLGWTAAGAALASISTASKPAANRGDPAGCFTPSAYAELGAQQAGLVLSTIDPGSAILAYTHHSVAAAPYHRNTAGNRLALLALAATPAEARRLITEAHVNYVALCTTSNEIADLVAHHPAGLAAALMAGTIPDWLVSMGSDQTIIRLFAVEQRKVDTPAPLALRPAL